VKIFELLKRGNAEIVKADEGDIVRRAEIIFNTIVQLRPFLTLFHLTPNTTAPFIALGGLTGTKKIQVNLTDHAFWLGSSRFFDGILEFRDYGIKVSVERRDYREDQPILMPYYPWTEDVPFKGFPIDTTDKVVMFSGGAMYKTEGGGNKYFNILKQIMDKHPELVFFYAGSGNKSRFEAFISDNGYQDRMFLLGQRNDINEVFKNSDIYYSTYPLFGGLMSQYAAINGIPILAFGTDEIESVVCTKKLVHFTFQDEKELIREADLLIENPYYRRERGTFFKDLCTNQEEFRVRMKKWIECGEKTKRNKETTTIDYDAFCEQYVERINNGSQGLGIELMLLRRCPNALSWKMWMNILLNLPEVVRVAKMRKSIS